MNVWERAKAAIRDAGDTYLDEGWPDSAERMYELLAEMEKVECVEGGSCNVGTNDKPVQDFWDLRDGDLWAEEYERPALLLLLPEVPHV